MAEARRHPLVGAARRWVAHAVVSPLEERLARTVRAEVERVVGESEFRARRDLLAAGERDAARSSAR